MIEQNLSLLLVVIPLIAAPVVAMLPNGRLPWLMVLAVTWICLAIASWQLSVVIDGNIISYELGGWAPPWGIEYRIDAMNALVALMVSGVAAITVPYALRSVEKEIPRQQTAFVLFCFSLVSYRSAGDYANR